MQEKTVIKRIFLLETATVIRENWILKTSLLGTTSYSSCAVHLNSVCPGTLLYTRLFNDPFEFNTSTTRYEEMCKRRLFPMPSELGQGNLRGVCGL